MGGFLTKAKFVPEHPQTEKSEEGAVRQAADSTQDGSGSEHGESSSAAAPPVESTAPVPTTTVITTPASPITTLAAAADNLNLKVDDADVKHSDTGNLSYEVVVSPARISSPPLPLRQAHAPSPKRTREEIQTKLEEAEKRRLKETEKWSRNMSEEERKRAEALARKNEKEEEFRATVQKELCEKMKLNKENRSKVLETRKQACEKELEKVSDVLESVVSKAAEEKEILDRKQENAQQRHTASIDKIKHNALEHSEKVERVRSKKQALQPINSEKGQGDGMD